MKRPPFSPKENIFGRGMGGYVLWIGLVMGIVSLLTGYFFWRENIASWQTIIFSTITLSQMGNVMALRSNRDSLFTIGIFSNRLMLGAVLLTVVLQLAVIYIPFLQGIFNTVALTWSELLISLAAGSVIFFAVELSKWVMRRRDP